ncbi:hypothetical protein AXA44_02780 [Rhodococcus sp. SC4]|nr:hypothetical protein AXA44_02780 [Rhodococcus sp. SC4]
MSDSAELVDSMLDAINEAGQLDGYSVWTEVGPERWAQSGAQGAATAYIEIVTPGEKLAECAHLIAFPMPTEKPVFDDGAAADRARDAQVDRENGVTP